MKVSIVITTCNRERYAVDALECVRRQPLCDRELLVVHVGYTDDTQRALEPNRSRITYVRTGHRGPAHARNMGIGRALGEYLFLLDSDDLWRRTRTLRASLAGSAISASTNSGSSRSIMRND